MSAKKYNEPGGCCQSWEEQVFGGLSLKVPISHVKLLQRHRIEIRKALCQVKPTTIQVVLMIYGKRTTGHD
jgi:hypothetical protein